MFKPPPLGTPDATGDLQRFPIPRLLFFLLKKAFLGTVTVSSAAMNGRIYFRDGMPAFTDIASSRDVLGRVLLERGVIDESTFNRSLQELAQTGQLQGQILIRLGAIDERTLIDGLRVQLHRKLNRLFSLAEAQIAIFAGEHGVGQQGEGAEVQADPLRVIYQGVRNCFDAARMDLELDKLQGHAVRLRPGFERRQSRYGMSDEEGALVAYLGVQPLSLETLLRTSHLSPLQTLMIVYSLWVTEALSATPDASTTGARRRSTPPVAPPPPRPAAATALPIAPPPPPGPAATAAEVTPPASPAEVTLPLELPPVEVPGVQDLARSFSTGLLQTVSRPEPAAAELEPIPLGEDMLSPDAPTSPVRSSAPLVTAPPPELGPILITPAPPTAPGITPPPPLHDLAAAEDVRLPFITPPPDELAHAPFITPPPPDELAHAPFITPPPELAHAPFITPPPPDELVDEAAPDLAELEEPAMPVATAAPARPAASPTPAGRNPRAPSPSAPALPSTAAVMEHKTLLRRAQERMKGQNHFDVLELKRDASADLVRDAYFRLAKIYHPDRCAALGLQDMQPLAEEIFRTINEAHAVLTDAERRKAYEEELDGGGGKKEALAALEAEFTFQKGVVLFRKKAFGEATRCFEDACRLNEKEGEHIAWLAWTRFNDPKVDNTRTLPQIKEQLLKAIKISPQNAICHYYLGEVYLAMGDASRARTCFSRTIELQPGHVEANRHLRLMQMRKEKADKKDKGLFGGLLKKK